VPGRSAPYDKLLMEYQRKNQAKLQKAQFEANAPDPDDDALPSGPIDEEEEKEQFMAGIAQGWGGAPLVSSTMVPLRKKYERTRIKSMLHSAFSSRNGNIFTVSGGGGGYEGLFGQAKEAAEDTGVQAVHARKPSVAPGARSMIPPARKASVASG
jgi:SAGA-associated factor 73